MANGDDEHITPPPVPTGSIPRGYLDDGGGSKRHRLTSYAPAEEAVAQLTPERTRVSLDLKMVFLLAAALVSGGVAAGAAFNQLTTKLVVLEAQMAHVVTKADLTDLRSELARTLRQRLGNAMVRCPTKRGGDWMECKIILVEDASKEPPG